MYMRAHAGSANFGSPRAAELPRTAKNSPAGEPTAKNARTGDTRRASAGSDAQSGSNADDDDEDGDDDDGDDNEDGGDDDDEDIDEGEGEEGTSDLGGSAGARVRMSDEITEPSECPTMETLLR